MRDTITSSVQKWFTSLVRHLKKLKDDLFATNTQDFDCLELAIEARSKRVVKYLLEHDSAFYLMRNAQNNDTLDTPIRKLIISMPGIALLIIEKCTLIVGAERSHVHRKVWVWVFTSLYPHPHSF